MARDEAAGKKSVGILANIAVLERELGKLEFERSQLAPAERERLDERKTQLLRLLTQEHARLASSAGAQTPKR